jgi:hypothetical protein
MTVDPADTDAVSVMIVPALTDVAEFPPDVRVSEVVVAVWASPDKQVATMIPKQSASLSI